MPYAKIIYVFGFLSMHASARAPVCQSASLPERHEVLPERQFCQSASFARAPVLPECQFCQSVTFARALVLPECQFCQSVSFARVPVLPECQFCQSASFARARVLPERKFCQSASFARAQVLPERQFCQSASRQFVSGNKRNSLIFFQTISYTELKYKRTALFQRIKTEITLTQKKMLKYIAIYD